jgi:phage head maturation protease
MSDTPDEAARGLRPSVPPDRRREGVRYLPATLEPTSSRAEGDGEPTTIYGHFGVFNRWTELDSMWEGHFLERFAPGSFKKTIRESRAQMRILLQHGMDPGLGDRPIADINSRSAVLKEEDFGPYYEAPLLRGVPELVVSGLEAGVYGASHRFRALREIVVETPEPSEENPKGLMERTVTEASVREFGPVTWGAYDDATAAVRSLTDEVFRHRLGVRDGADDPSDEVLLALIQRDPERLRSLFARVPDLADLVAAATTNDETNAPSESRAATAHPADERRSTSTGLYGLKPKETSWRI